MKTYPLPRRFLYVELLFYSLISTLMIVAWIPAAVSLIAYGSVFPSAMRAALFLNLTAITLIIFVLFVQKELRSISFFISEEQLGYRSSSRGKQIRLAGISSVGLLRFPLGGGILVIESPEGSLSIPLFIPGISDLVARLREYLPAPVSESDDTTDWNTIVRTCGRSESVTRRSLRVFRPVLSCAIAALPLNVFIGAVYWNTSIVPLMLWAVTGTLFPLATYGSADILLRILSGRTGKVLPDVDVENRLLIRAALAGGSIYLFCGILFKALIP
jgi:hypothetical protein